MDVDLELFGDKPVKTAPKGKFKPKAKPLPKKAPSIVPSPRTALKEQSSTQISSRSTSKQPKEVDSPLDEKLGVLSKEEIRNSEVAGSIPESVVSSDAGHDGPVQTEDSGLADDRDHCSNFRKPSGENADIFSALESLDALVSPSTATTVDGAKEPHPEVDGAAQLQNEFPSLDFVNAEAKQFELLHGISTLAASKDNPIEDERIDLLSSINNPDFMLQGVDAFASLESLEIVSESAAALGQRTGKFLPKPKVQCNRGTSVPDIPHSDPVTESLTGEPEFSPVPQSASVDECTLNTFPPANFRESSSSMLNNPSRCCHDGEPTCTVETVISDFAVPGSRALDTSVSGSSKKRRKSPSEADVCELGSVRSKRLRKRVTSCNLVDEPEDDSLESGDTIAEPSSNSARDEGDGNDDEHIVERASLKKRGPRKSKNPVAENGKKCQKGKKAEGPPKRFSHSTRRRRRLVDKVLLETPEDELNLRNIPLKDLILLHEHKERLAKAGKPETYNVERSTEDLSQDGIHNEGGTGNGYAPHNEYAQYDEDHPYYEGAPYDEAGTFDEDDSSLGQDNDPTIPYFNYHTYMDKTPKSRWSKQDTLLFYEGIRQFGTDMTMIQQLFPARTRRQVLLKYKKEERQNPSRLDDALRSRPTDHKYWDLVMEQVQKSAAENLDHNKDDDEEMANEDLEEGVIPKKEGSQIVDHEQEEATKAEQGDKGSVVDPELAQSPLKSYDGEDYDDDGDISWSQYKIDLDDDDDIRWSPY